MIINTGMRTDIPAFYAEWFFNRLEEGYVCTRNPYNPRAVTRYVLDPEVADVLVFCTKNPAPMLLRMDEIAGYGQYWFVTITPYGKDIEPAVPDKEKVMEDFKTLSGIVGVDAIGWRYDPIFINGTYTVERHLRDFALMAERLAGYTRTCVISFIDIYKKVRRNFPEAEMVTPGQRLELGQEFVKIGKRYDMVIKPCAEGEDLKPFGADCRGCMTLETFEKAIGCRLKAPRLKSPRMECACTLGNDIGGYDTCGHLCRYCYANRNPEAVRKNREAHDPHSPFLTGNARPDDVVHDASQASWRDRQMKLYL